MRCIALSFFMLGLFGIGLAQADTFQVSVNTTLPAGTTGSLAFDFIDGGPPSNSVTISAFSSNGVLGSPTLTGDAAGSLPGTVTIGDSSFFNEYLTDFKFGTTLSFSLSMTNVPPGSGSLPDEFSLYLLDSSASNSVVTTSDPTGADALFAAGSDGSLSVYTSTREATTVTPVVSSIPEPSCLALFAAAVLLLSGAKIGRRSCALILSACSLFAQSLPPYHYAKIVDDHTVRPDGLGNFDLPLGSLNPPAIDGEWVAFINSIPGGGALDLWSYNITTQQFTKLVDFSTPVPDSAGGGKFIDFTLCGAPYYPIQVHDGYVLFYGADSSAPICNFGHEGGLYAVPVGGGAISRVVDFSTTLPGSGGTYHFFDGNFYASSLSLGHVAFQATTSNGDIGIWTAAINGAGLARIADENTPWNCSAGSQLGCPNLFSSPSLQSGNLVFAGGGLFGEEGFNGLFVTSVSAPVLNPVVKSTAALPGDAGPDSPEIPDALAFFESPIIDGTNIYYLASDPNYAGPCAGGVFTGVFESTLTGASPIKILDTCDSPAGLGALNGPNSFESISAGGGTVAFQLENAASINAIYASSGGLVGKVIAQGDELFGAPVYRVIGNLGNNAVSQGRILFQAFLNVPGPFFGGIYLASPPCAANITKNVTLTRGGFLLDHATGEFVESVTITNSGLAAISGPISVVVSNLSAGATLANSSGVSTCSAQGSPYFSVPLGAGNLLSSGASETFVVGFTDPSRAAISYTPMVTAGAGTP